MPQALPPNPDLDWLKKAAKKRLAGLRVRAPEAKLHQAQLAVANDYGFRSWRALKADLDETNSVAGGRERVFAAARDGDVEAVRRAFASGFDPATQDRDGRTVYQIAKELRHADIELLARDIQGGRLYAEAEQDKVQAIVSAAQSGDVAALAERLDANPELIDAFGGRGLQKATALLAARMSRNQHRRTPLHHAGAKNRLQMMQSLLALGADPSAKGGVQ